MYSTTIGTIVVQKKLDTIDVPLFCLIIGFVLSYQIIFFGGLEFWATLLLMSPILSGALLPTQLPNYLGQIFYYCIIYCTKLVPLSQQFLVQLLLINENLDCVKSTECEECVKKTQTAYAEFTQKDKYFLFLDTYICTFTYTWSTSHC